MDLQPYLFFYGRCAEALEFYKRALGGTYDAQLVKDSTMAAQMPPEAQGFVMHASFTAGGIKFFASDGSEQKSIDPDAGNISLALAAGDDADGKRFFSALADGGNVKMPLEPAPWGDGKFGMLVDRFGVEWMMTAP